MEGTACVQVPLMGYVTLDRCSGWNIWVHPAPAFISIFIYLIYLGLTPNVTVFGDRACEEKKRLGKVIR